jgi:hypothetical protein
LAGRVLVRWAAADESLEMGMEGSYEKRPSG